jgi:hypothetical protein
MNSLNKMRGMSNFKVVNALVEKSRQNYNRAVKEWSLLASAYAVLLGNCTHHPVIQHIHCLILIVIVSYIAES